MRLIDADALKKAMDGYWGRCQRIRKPRNGETAVFLDIKAIVEDCPTIDAVPVRHGKWIDETFKPYGLVHHPFKCNLCGDHAEFASPYCPNCGTRMDGTQKKPCDDCQQFDCYGCEYAERKEE